MGGIKCDAFPIDEDYTLFNLRDPTRAFEVRDYLLTQPDILSVTIDSKDYFPPKSKKKKKKKGKKKSASGSSTKKTNKKQKKRVPLKRNHDSNVNFDEL